MERVCQFADRQDQNDPTWGFSDSIGLKIAGSALYRVVLSLLPKALQESAKHAKYFAVTDLSL